MGVVALPANQPDDRFYRGGAQIDAFRGTGHSSPHQPEDWVGSTTCVAGTDDVGMTRLVDGRLLRDAIDADPARWLSPAHRDAFGTDAKLLVKLLDAGQRLPVHAHPHRDFAREHLGNAHGKAEAWYILRGGDVHIGLREDVATDRMAELVRTQDSAALLAALNTVPVAPGDVVYVPPGVLHAIGEGVLILEVQEPEDLSILLEWGGFDLDGERDGHLGMGFDAVLPAVEHSARAGSALNRCIHRAGSETPLLPAEADEYFRLERVDVPSHGVEVEGGFAIAAVTTGSVRLDGSVFARGSTMLLDARDAVLRMSSRDDAELVIARPPKA